MISKEYKTDEAVHIGQGIDAAGIALGHMSRQFLACCSPSQSTFQVLRQMECMSLIFCTWLLSPP